MVLIQLATEAGLNPKLKSATHGGEYCSPCPNCGGTDRFLMWPKQLNKNGRVMGTYWCRQCTKSGDSLNFAMDVLKLKPKDAFRRCNVSFGYSDSQAYDNELDAFSFVKPYIPIEKNVRANPKWKSAITPLCYESHEAIKKHPEVLTFLAKRGIPLEAVNTYRLGYLSSARYFDRPELGLPVEGPLTKKVGIPGGITIPIFNNDKLIRLKVRVKERSIMKSSSKYWEVCGSLQGLNLIGDKSKKKIIVVESELDGFAVHWALKDEVQVIAIGSTSKHPDSVSHALIKNSDRLLVVCDNDDAGKAMGDKWFGMYSKAKRVFMPVGKDIGEAFEQGFDVAGFLKQRLSSFKI